MSEFLAKEGQFVLPMLDLITQAVIAMDELIDVAGRATIEAVLTPLARELAGAKHPGRKGDGPVGWHGRQKGVVCLAERKLRVDKPRLRRKGGGPGAELDLRAYAAMQKDSRLDRRMLEILMQGSPRGATARSCRRWPTRWAWPRARSAGSSSTLASRPSRRSLNAALTTRTSSSSTSTA